MFIFLLKPSQLLTEASNMNEVSNYLDGMKDIVNREEATQMIYSISKDDFTKETKAKGRNQILLKKLYSLKTQIIDFYLQTLQDNSKLNPEIKHNCDVYSTMGNFLIQILRLRMVIQPEIQITTNVHKQTKITYLTVKGFWLNDNGEKERKFKKSIGRADEYEMGKKDPKAIENCTAKMQSILMDEYLKYYPDK